MNKGLLSKLYWLVPAVILVFGFVLLFWENFVKVTEPPEPDWSRALTIGVTDSNKFPPVQVKDTGEFVFITTKDENLSTITLNQEFTVKETKTYDIPVDKWTQIFFQDETIIYFDYTNIYDQDKNVIVADVDQFYPLETSILYVKENVLYQLMPDSQKSSKMMEIDVNKLKIIPQENEERVNLLTYTNEANVIDIVLHEVKGGKISPLYQTQLKIDSGKIINDMSFALQDEKLALLIQEQLKSTQGKTEFFAYFMQTEITNPSPPSLVELKFEDPAGTKNLTEVSDVVLSYNNGLPSLLFHANGQTGTLYNDNTTINIYEAQINENNRTVTERRSNTPALSTNPQRVDEKTVAWLDIDPDGHRVNISSANIDAINRVMEFNFDDLIITIGKTLGMIFSSFFGFALTITWLIWPILFIGVMFIFRMKVVTQDPPWFFYTGIGIYAIATVIWKDQFFIQNIYQEAPSYLTFTGSSFVYMILFAILAYGLTLLGKRVNEWTGTLSITYFVGIHIILLTAFFGPYVL